MFPFVSKNWELLQVLTIIENFRFCSTSIPRASSLGRNSGNSTLRFRTSGWSWRRRPEKISSSAIEKFVFWGQKQRQTNREKDRHREKKKEFGLFLNGFSKFIHFFILIIEFLNFFSDMLSLQKRTKRGSEDPTKLPRSWKNLKTSKIWIPRFYGIEMYWKTKLRHKWNILHNIKVLNKFHTTVW